MMLHSHQLQLSSCPRQSSCSTPSLMWKLSAGVAAGDDDFLFGSSRAPAGASRNGGILGGRSGGILGKGSRLVSGATVVATGRDAAAQRGRVGGRAATVALFSKPV